MTGAAFERCGSPDLVYGVDIVGRPETGPFPLILCGAAMGGTTTSAQREARRQDNVGESNRAERSANVQTDRDKRCPRRCRNAQADNPYPRQYRRPQRALLRRFLLAPHLILEMLKKLCPKRKAPATELTPQPLIRLRPRAHFPLPSPQNPVDRCRTPHQPPLTSTVY